MPDVLIIAHFRLSVYLTLDQHDQEIAQDQARKLFGSGPDDASQVSPAPDVNFIYMGAPDGENGGWAVIVTGESYQNLMKYLRGPLSKMYDLDIHFFNRNDEGTDTNTLTSMVPFGWSNH